jgi:hypothetical protein
MKPEPGLFTSGEQGGLDDAGEKLAVGARKSHKVVQRNSSVGGSGKL